MSLLIVLSVTYWRKAHSQAAHSGDWLFTMSIFSCGLRLDNEAIRVAVALRLGLSLCVRHQCPCGTLVDASGSHSFVCRRAPGRTARHQALNDLIARAVSSAGILVTKEPQGLVRTDGRRPGGQTLIPWLEGKPMCWDVTEKGRQNPGQGRRNRNDLTRKAKSVA